MTIEEMQARKTELERMLRAREGKPGFAGNCVALRRAIAELDLELTLRAAPLP